MSKEIAPAFQFYAAEYLADEHVSIMSVEDEGCYIRLLAYCWREGSIPADPQFQARLCKGIIPSSVVTDRFDFPCEDETRLMHPRLESYREYLQKLRKHSSKGGRASAHKRKHKKDLTKQQSTCILLPSKTQVVGNTSASTSSSNNISIDIYPKGKRCPTNFKITDEMRVWAKDKVPGVDIDSETENFMDHQYKDVKTDWIATWRTWMRNSMTFKPSNGNGHNQPLLKAEPKPKFTYEWELDEKGNKVRMIERPCMPDSL
jgi:uncharacterized protein YdaU (DUF1376 family)